MNVLYLDHTSIVSGAQRSLLDLLAALPAGVEPVLACPSGPLTAAAHAAGVSVRRVPGTAGSLKLHPLHTPRALAEMSAAAVATARLARTLGADLVHANSIRAGLIAVAAEGLGGPPVVVHVRDELPPGRTTALVRHTLMGRAASVIAVSRHTARAFALGEDDPNIRVLANPVRLPPAAPGAGAALRANLGLEDEEPLLGLVGQITPWKGQSDAIRALALVRERGFAARLVLVGEAKFTAAATRYDNLAYLRELHALVAAHGLGDAVRFLGERTDVASVYNALDLLLLPSWSEPFGRAAVEAMLAGTPVLVTSEGGTAEIVRDGTDGRVLAPRDPSAWAEAATKLLADPAARGTLAASARSRAAEVADPERHRSSLGAAYHDAARSTAARKRSRKTSGANRRAA
jgi:glycosyltransferase involved in cell wall biosynthesis